MSRINDALSIIGKPIDEEKESPLDMVKSLLKGAALTTVAGAVGGTAGMRALGGYAAGKAEAKKQRRLDEISRAKNILSAEAQMAQIRNEEDAIKNREWSRSRTEKQDFQRQVDATNKQQQDLQKWKMGEETKRQGNAVKVAQSMLSAVGIGGGKGRSASRGTAGTTRAAKDPTIPVVQTPPALPPSPSEDQQNLFDKISGKNLEEILQYSAKVAQSFRSSGISDREFADNWPLISKEMGLDRLRPEDQEKVRNAIVVELSSPAKLAQYAKAKAEGGLSVPDSGATMTEAVADKMPVVGPTMTGAATGLAFGGPVGAVVGGLAGYKAGQAMDPNKPMLDYLPGSQQARAVASDVGQGVSSAGQGIAEAGRQIGTMAGNIARPVASAASSFKNALSSRIDLVRQALREATARRKSNLPMTGY